MYRREAQPLHRGPRAKLPEHFEHVASFAKRSLLSVSYAFAGYPMFEKEIWFKTLSAGMENRRTFKTAAVYAYSHYTLGITIPYFFKLALCSSSVFA